MQLNCLGNLKKLSASGGVKRRKRVIVFRTPRHCLQTIHFKGVYIYLGPLHKDQWYSKHGVLHCV